MNSGHSVKRDAFGVGMDGGGNRWGEEEAMRIEGKYLLITRDVLQLY